MPGSSSDGMGPLDSAAIPPPPPPTLPPPQYTCSECELPVGHPMGSRVTTCARCSCTMHRRCRLMCSGCSMLFCGVCNTQHQCVDRPSTYALATTPQDHQADPGTGPTFTNSPEHGAMPQSRGCNIGRWPTSYLVLAPVRWAIRAAIRIGSGFNLYGSEGPHPQQNGDWPHDMWEQLAMESADRSQLSRPVEVIKTPPGDSDDRACREQLDNYRKFVSATVHAMQRCIKRVASNSGTSLRVKDLPNACVSQWGTTLEKDRLGL